MADLKEECGSARMKEDQTAKLVHRADGTLEKSR